MEKNSDKSTLFSQKRVFEYNGKVMDFTRPRVMGILNVTPDSFYEAGRQGGMEAWRQRGMEAWRQGGMEAWRQRGMEAWRRRVEQMLEDGANIIDIGAVSTRPGAAGVSVEEENRRLMPPLKEIRKSFPELIISVDTYRAEITRMAAGEGADMINDISGGTFDPDMIPLVSELGIPYVIMHIRGTPRNMQVNPQYQNVTEEVFAFLLQQAKKLEATGHKKIILDPGFGFGKTVEHNYTLLSHLDRLTANGYTVLAGLSRKSMINRVLGTTPETALNGTTVLNTIALMKGATILRVHDVKEATEAIKLTQNVTIQNYP
ncbi:MAG: dihydropteroate synthase [Bacteroidales bacterium]